MELNRLRMSRMHTALVFLLAFGGTAARAAEQPDATAILDAAIKAHGGQDALGKIVARYIKIKVSVEYAGTSVSEEYLQPNKTRTVSLDPQKNVRMVEVVNGDTGWTKQGDHETKSLPNESVQTEKGDIYLSQVMLLVPLKTPGFRLAAIQETTVNGRKAIGIRVRNARGGDLETLGLYFDNETHLLVKCQFYVFGEARDCDYVFSDYREVQNTKQPFKIEYNWYGEKSERMEIMEMKLFDEPLDERLFSKP